MKNIYQFTPGQGLDFQVTAVKYATRFTGYFIMDVAVRWLSVSICYVANGRLEFMVGNFIAGTSEINIDSSQFIAPTNNNVEINISYILPLKRKTSNGQIHPMPFVAGMRTFDSNLTFAFTKAKFNTTTL
jgi:hypothetical protein